MKAYQYIIIGGGMTGSAAVKGIRENDPEGSIAVFTKEADGPYNRPPLTKGLWNNKDIESIIRPMDPYQVDLFLETEVTKIDPDHKQVTTMNGEDFQYQKLLLATGGEPIRLPGDPQDVIYYRTLEDFQSLKALTKTKDQICIIGGGFVGSELAAALTLNDVQVTMIFPESGISGTFFPDDLSIFLVDYYQEKGVQVHNGYLVDSITQEENSFLVQSHHVDTGQTSHQKFGVVIAGIGIKPNISLAQAAGINVQEGIVVNEFLQTNFPDVYAAGDVANFYNFPLKKRTRIEHEDNANTMGLMAGHNMSGDLEKYDHFPFFYSDLFDLGYEAVGDFNKDFHIFEDWIEPFKKGTLFYLKDDKIQGLIFWNLWGKVDEGRAVIQSGKSYKVSELKGMFTE